MGKSSEDPKRTKRNLLDDSDSESEDGGAPVVASDFKVNEDFARRFEHNKKREERQRRMYSIGNHSQQSGLTHVQSRKSTRITPEARPPPTMMIPPLMMKRKTRMVS